MINVGWDAASLAAIERILGFEAAMTAETPIALMESAVAIEQAAQANTWAVFANPTGELADSIHAILLGPTEAAVEVGVPYGMRREYGFSGMTDSLGRYYAYDPGKPYMQPAADDSHDAVATFFTEAVYIALGLSGA